MDDVYRQSFVEVLEVLKHSNHSIVEKIPNNFIEFLNQNKDNEYIVNIDFNDENWEKTVKEETQAILALIYRDYIVSQEERKRLLDEENEEKIKNEEKLKERYSIDNIFKKRNGEEFQKNEIALVEYKESIFLKIINKLKSIFNIKYKK